MSDLFSMILDSIQCPQCGSSQCGTHRCRFSGLTHVTYRTQRANDYADAMIRREKAEPKWLRDLKTGAKDTEVR